MIVYHFLGIFDITISLLGAVILTDSISKLGHFQISYQDIISFFENGSQNENRAIFRYHIKISYHFLKNGSQNQVIGWSDAINFLYSGQILFTT
jgi:hypothetical protein